MASRSFDLQEAEKLLPALEALLHTAISSKKKLEAVDADFTSLHQRIHLQGGIVVDSARMASLRQEKDSSVNRLREALMQIEVRGCLVKDLEIGLIDFPCVVNEQEVYLCWKLGEPHIGFWHYIDEGFAGRKPIDEQWREGGRPDHNRRPS